MTGLQKAYEAYQPPPMSDAEVVRKYSHLVDRLARQISMRIGSRDVQDDLWSVGALGLVDAARRFDPSRGIKFETFAQHRIRGAMLDELRQMDHLPRRLRQASEKVADARRKLSTSLGRQPSTEEVADSLKMDVAEMQELETLSQPLLALGSPEAESMEPAASEEPSPVENLMKKQMTGQLAQAIGELNEKQRKVVALYYVEGLTYREIAKVLGVSEPRICQIHGDAMKNMRAHLETRDAA
jgi:RNA polymerase sigma factor for flagellar operon FliA